ncbi:MAG TPA: mechanosensitive ion channel family protein [Corynebacteriales bacterium]|nr:mechanosensitive ion channel family protein [Mycobacteriales bacterium]
MNLAGWLGTEGLQILLIIVGSILLGRLAGAISRRFTNRITEGEESRDSLVRSEAAKHRYAVAQVLTYVVVALIVVVASVGVVERLGVSLTTLVAPATVLGAALGFGAQRIVQDFLAGFFVVTERHYGYGDVVEIWVSGSTQPAEGTVEDVTLRVTRLRTPDGEVITLPNGQITKTTNRSKDWARAVVDIPIPTEELGEANEELNHLCRELYEDEEIRPLLLDQPSVIGVQELGTDETVLRLVARTLPGKQFHVSRVIRAEAIRKMSIFGVESGKVTSMTADEVDLDSESEKV